MRTEGGTHCKSAAFDSAAAKIAECIAEGTGRLIRKGPQNAPDQLSDHLKLGQVASAGNHLFYNARKIYSSLKNLE